MTVNDFKMTGQLNETGLGLIRFDMDTPWERHGADELIIVFEGKVDLYLDDDPDPVSLQAGDVSVVPRNTWHRQEPKPQVALLFATASASTEHRALNTEEHSPNWPTS